MSGAWFEEAVSNDIRNNGSTGAVMIDSGLAKVTGQG